MTKHLISVLAGVALATTSVSAFALQDQRAEGDWIASEEDESEVAQTDTIIRNGQSYGWTTQPVAPADGAALSELDRLSKSASGVGFAVDVYDPASDNPLIPVSVTLRALDKITAKFVDLEVEIGQPQAFGDLTLIPRTCDKRPPEEFPETTTFLEVYTPKAARDDETLEQPSEDIKLADAGEVVETSVEPEIDGEQIFIPEGEAIFTGWMFASSPALNPLEHPVYDVWVIDCKMKEPSE
ncbi:MAG: DUF2155 domain-containing protein [Parvularculaceae bacterium]